MKGRVSEYDRARGVSSRRARRGRRRTGALAPILAVLAVCVCLGLFAASSSGYFGALLDDSRTPSSQALSGAAYSHADYVEASGMGRAPSGHSQEAQRKAMARRGAVVDLQRNLMAKVGGGGFIKNVEVLDEAWDGEVYRVRGRVRR
ncbi:MAG: hypothetical protein LBR38_09535 [Synergistaceae bacterium]|jgi:hypothetical protein|nr:hypothetical protein [Synergistaceae bacterium]